MRLLNLRPDVSRSKRSSARRLLQESMVAFVSVIFVLALVYVFLDWRLQQARQVNQALQVHLTQVAVASTDEGSQYVIWRTKNAGQLNWLALLPQLTDEHIRLTQVLQKKEGIQISGRADSAVDAQRLIARVNQVFAKPEALVESLEGKADGWYFVVQTMTHTNSEAK